MTVRALLAVTYYDERKRDLAADCLLPLAAEAAADARTAHAFLRRHWKHGPQLQLWVTGEDAWALEAVLHAALPAVEDWLARQPSRAALDREAYLRRCEALGRAELEPPPYAPVWPDNSARALRDARRGGLITNPEALALRDTLCDRARPVIAGVLARERAGDSRLAAAVALITGLAVTYPDGGLARGFFSFKSHLEDFLFDHDAGDRLRAQFEQRYATIAATAERMVARIARDSEPEGRYRGGDEVLHAWSGIVRDGWDAALRLAQRGAITPLPDPGYLTRAAQLGEDVARKWAGGEGRGYSDFHQRLRGLSFTGDLEGRRFASYRFLTNTLYELLPLLDVAPVERYFLCHAVSEASQAILGKSWLELLPGDEEVPA